MKAAFYIFVASVTALISGCKSGPTVGDYTGEWKLYTPFSKDPGAITFRDGKFHENIDVSFFAMNKSIIQKGDYSGDKTSLTLSNVETVNMRGNPNTDTNFVADWQSADLVYLTSKSENGGGTLAIARNGATPDMKKLSFEFSGSVKGGGYSIKKPGDDGWISIPNEPNKPTMPSGPTPENIQSKPYTPPPSQGQIAAEQEKARQDAAAKEAQAAQQNQPPATSGDANGGSQPPANGGN